MRAVGPTMWRRILRVARSSVVVLGVALCLAAAGRGQVWAVEPLSLRVQPAGVEGASAQQAAFTPNPVISFQGRLIDPSSGLAKPDGAYNMVFRIYALTEGGAPLWEETHPNVSVQRSVFSVLLGDVDPLDAATFNGQGLWLGITVGSDLEMAPRMRIAHTAYALFAEHVKDGSVSSASVADGSLTGGDVLDNALTTADIADGSGSGIDADLLDGLNSNAFAGASHSHSSLPIAFGFINSSGSKLSGTSNVSSVWNAGLSRYEITITGQSYFWTSYTTLVTQSPAAGTSCDAVFPAVGSISGKLTVSFRNTGGGLVQCYFQFVTFKP